MTDKSREHAVTKFSDMSYQTLSDITAVIDPQSEEYQGARKEMTIRQLTGSSVECGKAFLQGFMEMHDELGSLSVNAERNITTFKGAIDRTSSKVLIKLLNAAIKKMEASLELPNKETKS